MIVVCINCHFAIELPAIQGHFKMSNKIINFFIDVVASESVGSNRICCQQIIS